MNPSMPWKQDHGTDRWVGSGMDWEFVVDRCRLLDTGWLNNKVLLYGTGNCSQYPVMNHSGKEYEKERVRVYIHETESLCSTAEINATLWINYTSI